MQLPLRVWFGIGALTLGVGCRSEVLDGEGAAGAANASGGNGSMDGNARSCSSALRQSLGLVDAVSEGAVSVLDSSSTERTLYVDASAGGVDGQDEFPWIYIALATGTAVAVTDLDALSSTAWDLAMKRSLVRTNGGDSGPGDGGAIRLALPWDSVDESTLGSRRMPKEDWFDADCELTLGDTGEILTTFSGWSEYDPATHVLSPADVVFLTRGADGALYKVAVLDYYSNPNGTRGTTSGHYQLRVAAIP